MPVTVLTAVSETVGDALKSAAKAFSAGDSTGDKPGSVGGKFRSDGEIGKEGEKVGGTFSSQAGGAVGSQFDKDGAVGGVSNTIPSLDQVMFSLESGLLTRFRRPCS